MKIMASLQAFPTLPPHPPPPLRISLPPKIPFPFKRLPRSSVVFEHCIDQAYLKVESLQ